MYHITHYKQKCIAHRYSICTSCTYIQHIFIPHTYASCNKHVPIPYMSPTHLPLIHTNELHIFICIIYICICITHTIYTYHTQSIQTISVRNRTGNEQKHCNQTERTCSVCFFSHVSLHPRNSHSSFCVNPVICYRESS